MLPPCPLSPHARLTFLRLMWHTTRLATAFRYAWSCLLFSRFAALSSLLLARPSTWLSRGNSSFRPGAISIPWVVWPRRAHPLVRLHLHPGPLRAVWRSGNACPSDESPDTRVGRFPVIIFLFPLVIPHLLPSLPWSHTSSTRLALPLSSHLVSSFECMQLSARHTTLRHSSNEAPSSALSPGRPPPLRTASLPGCCLLYVMPRSCKDDLQERLCFILRCPMGFAITQAPSFQPQPALHLGV